MRPEAVAILARALRGAAAGAVATVPMTAVLSAARRADKRRELPPTRITRVLVRRLRRRGLPRVPLRPATAALHLGYGAAMGALFGGVSRARGARSVLVGAAFGVAVYAASYAGWIPWARIFPTASRDRPRRQAPLAAAHVVYGAVLGALARDGGAR